MAKLLATYKAMLSSAIILQKDLLETIQVGNNGLLLVYESQRKHPGKPFLVFYTDESVLHTAPGEIEIGLDEKTISLTSNGNFYQFQIIAKVNIVDGEKPPTIFPSE